MNTLESIWFLTTLLIIGIILLVDPKSSIAGSANDSVLGKLTNPSSDQQSVYYFSGLVIGSFFVLSLSLSFVG